ncbi:MAG TPA: transketolase C-terminal domain-containing protein [Oscillospiraceae bacterium]|nr:transketolase family protein [Oscillospiraceae bacterium]HNW04877.1 transketolase C-terminal domain-containing protein [Oscillospiraceae bacterium]
MEMRAAFFGKLGEMMEQDERICVLDADLGKANGTMKLHAKFPERAFDCGIAEQNMASVAAGMASYGYIPFITTFTPFATRRICDQIAVSIAYARQNVKIVGTDPGISAQLNGGTHMSLEDVGVLRSIPTMVIFEPADEVQAVKSLPQIIRHDGPVYIRLYRKEAPAIFSETYDFDLFKADQLTDGADVTIFATGIMLKKSLDAAEMLKAKGIGAEVVNVHTIKPLDAETVLKSLSKTRCAVVAENHSVIGGLFSAICETAARNLPTPIFPVGTQDVFGEVGKLPYLLERFGMTEADIAAAAEKAVSAKSSETERIL